MSSTNTKEDHNQREKTQKNEKMVTTGKIQVKKLHEILKDSSKNTNPEYQRAIQGLSEIPDEELIKELGEDDFMQGLDVLDAWEGEEEKNHETEQNAVSINQEKRSSREHHRPEPKASSSREKPKREEKKREETRRDPLKSTKDIERDKIRTKRDTDNKLLAEKEKAIKHLLDSDNVVPPGTEVEAIQSIKEEQNRERAQREAQRNKEHRRSAERYARSSPQRRRTPDRSRQSPHRRRSPFSPDRRKSPFPISSERHRSPHKYSPTKRKNSPRYFSDRRSPALSPDRRRSPRRLSRERRSNDRRWSAERHRRRADTHERRRSRSRDRRSRSTERSRRRSSRSPASRRYSPRHRSRTRSRSVEKRPRKRSPFINELARQLRDGVKPGVNSGGYGFTDSSPATKEGIAVLLNSSGFKQEPEPRPPPPVLSSPYVHQPGPLPPPPPPPPPAPMLPMTAGPPFMNFEPVPGVPLMNFDSLPRHTLAPVEYASGPVMYNQPNSAPIQPPLPPPTIRPPLPLLPAPVPSPQPVPAPVMDHAQIPYNPLHGMPAVRQSPIHQLESSSKSSNHSTAAPSTSSQSYGPTTLSYNECRAVREERMKTPEPPVISKRKKQTPSSSSVISSDNFPLNYDIAHQFEKTSLSSLLEASVSAKDPSNIPVLYPGFNPAIMQFCDQALCHLPFEDPRLKMKGRFFYSRTEEDNEKHDSEDHTSNSILLQKGKTKIYWEENNMEQQVPVPKTTTQMHQKICQTDEVETETKGVQAVATMTDFAVQVYPHDLQEIKEEKRPIMTRLDWSGNRTREPYEPASRFCEEGDLRWSLNNSSQRRSMRQMSPARRSDELEHHLDPANHESREIKLESTIRNRDGFSGREHYGHGKYSPDYHRRSMERDDFHDRRSNHSRGESPMELEDDSDNETVVAEHTFQRGSDWHAREKILRGKGHNMRGKHLGGKSYRNYRGKF